MSCQLVFCCLFISTTSRCCPPPILCKDCARRAQFSCKRVQSRTIALSQMSKIEFTRILPWRAIALLRTCSGYAERSRIFVQASAIELAHIAERSRKSQEIMPSTAENIELVKIRATDQVAINIIEPVSCKFVKFVGHKNQGLSGARLRPYRLNSAQNK